MGSTSAFALTKSNQKVSVRNMRTRIRKMRVTSLEGISFSSDCEVKSGTTNDGGTVEVCLVYTLVGSSCLEGNVSRSIMSNNMVLSGECSWTNKMHKSSSDSEEWDSIEVWLKLKEIDNSSEQYQLYIDQYKYRSVLNNNNYILYAFWALEYPKTLLRAQECNLARGSLVCSKYTGPNTLGVKGNKSLCGYSVEYEIWLSRIDEGVCY